MNQSGCNCENVMANEKTSKKQKCIKGINIAAILVSIAAVLGLVGYFVVYPKIAYWSGDYKTYIDMRQIQHFSIPDGVRDIPDHAFENCDSLESVTIPDSVKSIGEFAFAHCHSLESVMLGDGVENIGKSAFYGCESLTSITYGGGIESIENFAFSVLSKYENQAKRLGKGHFDTQRFAFSPDVNSKRYIFEPLAVGGAEHVVLKIATPTFIHDGFGVFDAANNQLITQGCTVLQSDADYTYVCYDISAYDAIYCSVDAWSFDVLEIYLI